MTLRATIAKVFEARRLRSAVAQRRERARAWLPCVAIVGALSASACATTQPWERELLAKPCMRPDPHPFRDGLRHHYLSTREGAVGGLGGGGGGCGCN